MNSSYEEKISAVLKEIKINQYRVMDEIIEICHLTNAAKKRRDYSDSRERAYAKEIFNSDDFRFDNLSMENVQKDAEVEFVNEINSEMRKYREFKSMEANIKKAHKKKKKSKKKLNKKNKKRMMKSMLAIQDGNIILEENSMKKKDLNANLLAEMMQEAVCVKVKNGSIRLYKEDLGCFKQCSEEEFSQTLRSLLTENNRRKISTSEYKEALNQLLRSEEVIMKDEFFANKPYVNCLNGVLNVKEDMLLPHSPEFLFKHCICANYNKKLKCIKFLEYLDMITGGDEELKELIQVMMGYIFSHYSNAKVAFLIYSAPHAGKSVLCRVIEKVVGEDASVHVELADFTKQEYASALDDMILNVASDLENKPLREVGCFKKLVSHDDTITTRSLYSNPKDLKSEAIMLFSSNHYLEFDSSVDINDVMAVFKRLVYIPFQNPPISEDIENKHMSEELLEERDAIFTWAMEGLKKYILNGERIPKSRLSEEIKNKNIARYCPEKIFFDTCIKEEKGSYVRVSTIKDAYDNFYRDNYPGRKGDIIRYISEIKRIPKTKQRVNEYGERDTTSTGKYGFIGIKMKDKYRV